MVCDAHFTFFFLCQKKETKKGHHTGQPQNRFSHNPSAAKATDFEVLTPRGQPRTQGLWQFEEKISNTLSYGDWPSRKWQGDCAGEARESSLFEPKRVALGEFRGFTAMCVAEATANFLDRLDFLVLLRQGKRTKKMAYS